MKNKDVALIFSLIILSIPLLSQAHETKLSGDIAATMHLEPQDDPVVGAPAQFYFYFKDFKERFAFADCDCFVSISQKDEILLQEERLQVAPKEFGSNSGTLPFVFPKKAVYTIVLSGKSKTAKFEDFKISYYLRVERAQAGEQVQPRNLTEAEAKKQMSNLDYKIAGGIAAAGIIFYIFRKIIKKTRQI